MHSENNDQSNSSHMIQKNHSYTISVSPEKSDLHLFFCFSFKKKPSKELL